MNNDFSMKLKTLMTQLDISNAQLARGLHVDPSLVSRWLKNGFGSGKRTSTRLLSGSIYSKGR